MQDGFYDPGEQLGIPKTIFIDTTIEGEALPDLNLLECSFLTSHHSTEKELKGVIVVDSKIDENLSKLTSKSPL
jgi:hypothetical protein